MQKHPSNTTLRHPKRKLAVLLHATGNRTKAGFIGLLAAGAIGFYLPANADIISVPLDFTAANQSLWGPGGLAADFGASGGASLGSIAGVNIGYDYDIGASSGTVSAQYQGGISVDYTPSLSIPGTTSISLNFVGDTNGGNVTSDLGAWARVNIAGISVLNEGYGLNINQDYTAQLGQSGSGSDTVTLGNSGVDIIVASAGVNFNIEQTDTLTANAISGTLVASLQGTSTSITQAFTLTASGIAVDLGLSDTGIWDIDFRDLLLGNTFSTDFAAQLQPYVTYTSGVDICYVWGVPYPCGITTSAYSVTLASIDVYDPDPFSLAFGRISRSQGFSITVGEAEKTVPEPATLALLGIGLAGLVGLRRRKHLPS